MWKIPVLALLALILVIGAWAALHPHPTPELVASRLNACGSLPNGSTQQVKDTTRMFIYIPKDMYPNKVLQMVSNGASAGNVSNAGLPGQVQGTGKPNCWSYYFEFDGNGSVDLVSKGVSSEVPNYHVHFVVASPNAAATSTKAKTAAPKQAH